VEYGLKGFICKVHLVGPLCCFVPRIGVGDSWPSVRHGGNLVLDA